MMRNLSCKRHKHCMKMFSLLFDYLSRTVVRTCFVIVAVLDSIGIATLESDL